MPLFANYYLDGLQRPLRCHTGINAELRHVDDVWIGYQSKETARDIVTKARDWLLHQRKLTLKPACIRRSAIGQTFCGFHISRDGLCSGVRWRRVLLRHYQALATHYQDGDIDERQVQSGACAIAALAKPGDHRVLTRRLVHSSGLNQLC